MSVGKKDNLSRLYTLLVFLILNGIAKNEDANSPVDRQTPVKTLPCPKRRLLAVKI